MDAYIPPAMEAEAIAQRRQADRLRKRDPNAVIAMKKRLKFLIWEAITDDMRGEATWDDLECVLKGILVEVHHNRVIGFNLPPKK